MAKSESVLMGLAVASLALLFLGTIASADCEVAAPGSGLNANADTKSTGSTPTIGSFSGNALFSGVMLPLPLNRGAQQQPVFQIGAAMGRGLFSGHKFYSTLNPQPEPPLESKR